MPIFNTPRADRSSANHMENLIRTVWGHEKNVYREGFGVCDFTPDVILASFNSVRKTFGKINPIQVHNLEIFVESEFGADAALGIGRYIGTYFYNLGFCNFVSIIKLENYYLIEVVINAVSHIDGRAFKDNNQQLAQIYADLKLALPADWKLTAMGNVFFDTENLANSYVHGTIV